MINLFIYNNKTRLNTEMYSKKRIVNILKMNYQIVQLFLILERHATMFLMILCF